MNKRQLFLNHVAQTSPSPLAIEIERAEGMYLYDGHGKSYLDLIAGIGVSCLGHRYPAVQDAIKAQVDKYLHTLVYGEYILSPQYQLAHALSKVLPDPIDSFYFVNSGSEATEGAMKLAKRYTGRAEFIACRNAYHGSTQGSASLMAPTDFTQAYHPLLPGIKHIEYNCNFCLQKITTATAAVIVEPVQAEWGIRPPFQDFLQQVRKRCDETGALLIFDEIQTGFGRTGAFFACQKYGVTPDIILMAKGMGGGMPIGAFGASREIMQVLSHNPILGHITTFGGHPVSCAASLATLKVLQEEDYIAQVEEKEKLFHQLLKHPHIREVRSSGLMMGVQLDSFPQVQKVIEYCLANGVITDWFLFNSETIRIAPPLIIEQAEIEFACEILLKGIDFAKQN